VSNKMENWLEQRIEEERQAGRSYHTAAIINELVIHYHIKRLTREKREQIATLIKRIKERIKKRNIRRSGLIAAMGRELNVPKRLVARWVAAGKMEIEDKQAAKGIVDIVRERDYYLGQGMKPSDIPHDNGEPLWGK